VHLPRQKSDLALARRQHAAYVAALEAAGVCVRVLPEARDLPDAVFVEDPLLVRDEFAVICRPGFASRERETEPLAREIAHARPVFRVSAPATPEGGDVLQIGNTFLLETRTGPTAKASRNWSASSSGLVTVSWL
jgi:dimethylargininase